MEEVVKTDKGDFAIRPYAPEDEEGVLSLWKSAFGKEMTKEFWRWKYGEGPYGRQIMLCVGETGKPVAMYSGIPYRANWKGESVRFTHLMDNASHPDYRSALGGRSGLFIRTARTFFARYGGPHASVFIYGFPGRRHFLLGEKLLHYGAFMKGVTFLTASTAHRSRRGKPFSGKAERIRGPDASLADLAEKSKTYFPFGITRDPGFLEWRFLKHPERVYEIWGYRYYLKREWRAYAVFLHEADQTCLVDLSGACAPDAVGDFLARLLKILSKRGILSVKTWLPAGHFLVEAALSAGFRSEPEPLGFIPGGRTFHADLPFDWAAKNIFYTMADGDLF